jgi:GAF domain-containing protein/CheY-like chemotaxis protein
VPTKAWGLEEDRRSAFLALRGVPGIPAVVKAVQGREPVVVEADHLHTLIPGKVAAALDIRSMLIIPLVTGGRLVGTMAVDTPGRLHAFTSTQIAIARGIAAQAAAAIDNARLFEETERGRREADVVAELAGAINAARDLDTVLQRVADAARELCRADLATIGLADVRANDVVVAYRAGARCLDYAQFRIASGKGLDGRVLATGRPCRTRHYAEDPEISKDYLAITQAEGTVTAMVVPIRAEGRIEGLLYVANRTPRPFTDRDEAVLVRLADQAGIAIRNGQLFAREQLARIEAEASRATFRIYLPRVADIANGPAEPPAGPAPATQTVLLVEDEEGVRELSAEILREQGYTVLVAATGPEALALAARHAGAIHLVVSDLVMPQMSGRELAGRLTALRPDARVLYISGYHADIIGKRGILDPDTPFLQKPFTPDGLARKVREVLDARRPG